MRCGRVVATILLLLVACVDASAQTTRTARLPHYITGVKQVEPDAAAIYCSSAETDAFGRRSADVINRLAREIFGDDAEGVSVPLKNSDVFTAPRVGGGKRGQAATFEITYSGFTPEAKTAFQYAVDVWSALIDSPVPIKVEASWTSLSPGVLGSAGPEILHAEFGAGEPDTWYASALANALAGEDLSTEAVDIVANFNSDFSNWYFGLDGATPIGQIDFVTVVMHEIGHGLGFFGTMDVDDGTGNEECTGVDGLGCWGFDGFPGLAHIYERFSEDAGGTSLVNTTAYPNPSTALGDVLTSGAVFFDGPAAVSAYGARPPLYAPPTWNSGSSFSHVDENSFPPGDPSSLMTPFVAAAEAIHDPGTVGCGIFADMGWSTTSDCGTGAEPETPSIPVPLSPDDGQIDVPTEVTFSWQESLQADAYTLEVAKTEFFTSPVVTVSGITETSYTISHLEHATQYFWHVRAINAESVSAYSTTHDFVTASPPPAAPALVAPADQSASLPTTITFDWQSVADADQYVVEIDTTADFNAPVHRITTAVTELQITGLRNEQTYFWRVSAQRGSQSGEWSDAWSFTTIIALPAPPRLVAPEDESSSVSINTQLAWNSAARADLYEVVLATDSTFNQIVADSVLSDTTFAVSGLANKTSYHWRVRGRNDSGAGAWSAIFHFQTIVAAPAVPRLASPENGAKELPREVTFVWEPAVDAAAYEFELSTSLNFDSPVLRIDDIDTTTVTVTDLEYGTQYFWRVRAINPGGRSVFTSPFSFFTQIAPPSDVPNLASPFSGATGLGTSVQLAWNPVSGATGYRIQVSGDSTFSSNVVVDSSLTAMSIVVNDLAFDSTYFWRVSALNAGGQGEWSTVFKFSTRTAPPEAAPVLVSPPHDATGLDRSVILDWEPVTAAATYRVEVSRDSAFTETVLTRSGLENTDLVLSNLDLGTTYFWRVAADNDGGHGPWSPAFSFTTQIAAPAAPVLNSPADRTTGIDTTIVLDWEDVASAATFSLVVSRDSSFEETVLTRSGLEVTEIQVSDLEYEATYFWRVRAANAGGEGPWSETFRFTTKQEPSRVGADRADLPHEFRLDQNYPNPFNPTTTFRFSLARAANVRLEVIDVTGRMTAVVVDEAMPAGRHEVAWTATDLPSGTYVYRLRAGDFTESRTLVLLK